MTESSMFLDAHVEAKEAARVQSVFQKLHDHRDYSFIVELPAKSPTPDQK